MTIKKFIASNLTFNRIAFMVLVIIMFIAVLALKQVILSLKVKPLADTIYCSTTHPKTEALKVKVTTFNATPEQGGKTPLLCRSGRKVKESTIIYDRIIGLSPDLFLFHHTKFGDTVEIQCAGGLSGKYVVETTTSSKLHRTVDILIPTGQKHTRFTNSILIFK